MNEKRTTVMLDSGSYAANLPAGVRSDYFRMLVDNRLSELRAARGVLGGHSNDEIVDLVAQADLPARETHGSSYALLQSEERDAVDLFAAESEITRLSVSDILECIKPLDYRPEKDDETD